MEERKDIFRQLITFFGITILISTGVFIWMFNGGKDNVAAILLMMWTPGIAAFITSFVLKDKISIYGWKPGKIRFLIYAYLFPLAVSLIAYGIVWLSGFTEFTNESSCELQMV